MQCSFCGKELMVGQECDCSMYQDFKNMQMGSAPQMTPPPVANQAPPRMTPPPMANQVPPRMTPPPVANQGNQAAQGQVPPRMTPPPAANQGNQAAQGQVPPRMTPPAANQGNQATQGQVPPRMTPPPTTYQGQQTSPPMGNQGQQAPPPMGNQGQQVPPPRRTQSTNTNGATNSNGASSGTVQVNINIDDAKKMTKEAGQKMSAFWYHIKKMLGFGTSAEDEGVDPFERGKDIIPEISNSCEGEIPVKQYRVANFRSRLKGLWAEGKIQVTNKRVIFRAAGRSILGKTTIQQEYIIDEIAGIDISNGIRVDFFEMILALIFGYPLVGFITFKLAMTFLRMDGIIAMIFCIALAVLVLAPFVVLKGFLLLKALGSFSAALIFMVLQYQGQFFQWLFFLCIIISFFVLFLFALRPSVSIAIMSKAGTGTPVSMQSPSHFRLETAREMLPAEDIDMVQKEIGAIISDIQKFGDYGIEKWKA